MVDTQNRDELLTVPDVDPLLTVPEVAVRLRRSVAQVRWMRHSGTGPPSANVAGGVMFRRSELERWIDQQFNSEASTPA